MKRRTILWFLKEITIHTIDILIGHGMSNVSAQSVCIPLCSQTYPGTKVATDSHTRRQFVRVIFIVDVRWKEKDKYVKSVPTVCEMIRFGKFSCSIASNSRAVSWSPRPVDTSF